jgi:enoyl-CoA hydratase
VVEPDQHLVRALELAETLAAFPQEAMLADRRSAIEGIGRPFDDGMWLEARRGVPTVASSQAGAARFAGGAGRSGRAG